MYIPISTAPPAPPSREAQELAELLTAATEAYQRENPQMSPLDVREAMRLAQRAAGGADITKAKKSLLVGFVAVFVGLGVFYLRSNGPPGDAAQSIPWMLIAVVGVAVVLVGMAIANKR